MANSHDHDSFVPQPWRRPMHARDPHEAHRAATPLELLYDLCFVVAIAQAAAGLHHSIADGHTGAGLLGFVLVFFAIWWAWMGFAWFASAFDTDDVAYRLKVLVQIVGVLVLAAGVPRALNHQEWGGITLGYVIMRVGLIAQWLRAAKTAVEWRQTALRYAAGVTLCQVGWLLLLLVPPSAWVYGWLLMAPLEMLVPVWAERARPTPWHPHHIAERYGLLTIIVLGESVLAATIAVQSALDAAHPAPSLLWIILGAPLIIFSMWWLYFFQPAHSILRGSRDAFIWGYGHFFVFASAAAVGTGVAVAVDQATAHAELSARAAGMALAIPVAIYLISTWCVMIRPRRHCRPETVAYALAAVAVLLAPLGPGAPLTIGLVLSALTAHSVMLETRHARLKASEAAA